jgi:hypothetical protein
VYLIASIIVDFPEPLGPIKQERLSEKPNVTSLKTPFRQ